MYCLWRTTSLKRRVPNRFQNLVLCRKKELPVKVGDLTKLTLNLRSRHDREGLRPTPCNVQACDHVANHAAVELVSRKTTQLGEYGLTIGANVDVGIRRIKSDRLIGIESKRPCTGSVLNVVERVESFQRCQPGFRIESERHFTVACRRA